MLALLLPLGPSSAQANRPLDVNGLRSAAEGGDVRAQVILGKAYLLGESIETDDEQGVFWLRQAARDGDRVAQAWFGWAYEQGRGVRKDTQRAYSWYSRSARQGYEWAQQQLGRLQRSDGAMANVQDIKQREQPVVTRRAADPAARQHGTQASLGGGATIAPVFDAGGGIADREARAPTRGDPQLIAEQLRDWVVANLKTQMPEKVKAEQVATVTLELPTPPELEQWQAAGIGIRVQADLQVDGTVVEPLTKPEQALRPHHGAAWRWEIRAVQSGVPLFDLSVRGRIMVPDREPLRVELMRLGPRVEVEPSWSKRMWTLARENQTAIGLTLLVPLFLWLGMSFAARRR